MRHLLSQASQSVSVSKQLHGRPIKPYINMVQYLFLKIGAMSPKDPRAANSK